MRMRIKSKHTCGLTAVFNESTLIHCSLWLNSLMPVGNIILVKMIDMKSIPVLLSCRLSIHVYAIKKLTENQNEIFNETKSHTGLSLFHLSCERTLDAHSSCKCL